MPPSLQKLLLTENRDRLQAALADRYRLDRELGRGGMATVFLAQDLRHDRPVALKVLHPELAASLGPERFLREIRLAARLQHPHILTVHDSGEAAGQLWFTMPYVEGESLRQLLTRQKQLPVADALRIAREASLALEYAHRHGVIHRDIKPENLLLTTDGSTLVADFGIARALGGASDQLTETGMAVGTPAYMSPEQASGGRDLDARTDVYSLGAVLYEMLTGEPPFTGPTAQAVIVKRFSGEVPRIRLTRAAVPEAVEQAVTKALQLLPADRHATAAEFAQALTATTPSSDRENAPVGRVSRRRIPLAFALGIGFIVGLGVLFAWRKGRGGSEAAGGPKLLAVLPFENLGGPEDEYFADGMTDAVRGKLAGLTGLRVISRGSTGQYKKSTKSPTQIGQELGVQYLLTARIRWEKVAGGASRVQVSPELIEVSDATTRWQQPFDAQLSDVFQVQGQIASQVAQALNVALAATERQQLAERPTANLAAYDAFLQGEEASGGMGTPGALALRRAAGAYEQAVALDSGFAIAWARLSEAYALNYANTSSGADAERARFAAERAVALAPGRPEGHLALGKYYEYVRFDYGRALEEFGLGQRAAPNNANLLTAIAAAEQSLGKWEASLEHLRQAETLDPRSVLTARRIARALLFLRRYVEALAASNRALALAPANPDILETKAMVYLAQGDLADARAVLQPPPETLAPTEFVAYIATYWDLYWALNDSQQALLLSLTPREFDGNRATWGLALAGTYALQGNAARTHAYADSARLALEAQIREAPENGYAYVALGVGLAFLGHKAEAVREGERGLAMQPIAKDAYLGAYNQHQLARICILVGEYDKALDLLELLLKIPYFVSPGWLKIDPTFDPLRGNPRFERLVAGR